MTSKYDYPNNYDLDAPNENRRGRKKGSKNKPKTDPNYIEVDGKKMWNHDLTIYPIQIDDDKKNQGEPKYPLSSPVHLHLVVGRVKAGKSLLVNNLYLSERFFKDDFKTRILISSTAYNDAVNKYMIDEFDFVFTDYSEELLAELISLIEKDEGPGRWLILLDDVIGDVKFNRSGKIDLMSSLITKFRHIGNGEVEGKLSLCICTQYFRYIGPTARNNATAYYFMGAFPDNELKKIAESLSFFGGNDRAFLEIFNRSRKKEYDFLYCSVEHLEARRNHDELIWSKEKGWEQPWEGSTLQTIDEEDENAEE